MNAHPTPGELLLGYCRDAKSVLLAAPYIKYDALERVLSVLSPTAEIWCVTRWIPHDIAVGASDTKCRKMVLEAGGTFRLHPNLHAKYYHIDNTVLIGSANLTGPALGWADRPNLEVLSQAGDDLDAQGFEHRLLTESREISDAEFVQWESIDRMKAREIPAVVGPYPQLDDWRPGTRDPRNFELRYRGREKEIASPDERRLAFRDLAALAIPQGLSVQEARTWVSTCLLSAPFTCNVIRLQGSLDVTIASRILAQTYGLSMRQARRDMEAVQSWLRFFAPEVFP